MLPEKVMLMTGILTAASLLAGCAAEENTAAAPAVQAAAEKSSVTLANPFVDYSSLEEAEAAAGFSFSVPEKVTAGGVTSAVRKVQVMSGRMIQVIYEDSEGNELCMLRKQAAGDAAEDLTGDYTEYAFSNTMTAGSIEAEVRGESENRLHDAVWQRDGYDEALYSEAGMTAEEMHMVLENTDVDAMSVEEYLSTDACRKFRNDRAEAVEAGSIYQDTLHAYLQYTMPGILQDDGIHNVIYSPANVYIELAMLAQCTSGETQQQLLYLLGLDDPEGLPVIVNAIWDANAADNPLVTTTFGNSIWLQDDLTYNEETLQTLSDRYHADSYVGDLAGREANDALHQWINSHTGNLLTEAADGMEMDQDTVMSLVSTLYLKASWQESFDAEQTTTETFHGAEDMDVSMMHQTISTDVYQGNGFRAMALQLSAGGRMWIFLPDEGTDLSTLPASEDVYHVLKGDGSVESIYADVHLSLPKFDVQSDLDLGDSMRALGVTDIFTDAADFSPLTTDTGCYVSMLKHAARVKADEDGIEAAAFTAAMIRATSIQENETCDFRVDHPFMFAVQGEDGSVLFAGLVNNPGAE